MEFTFNSIIYRHNETSDRYSKTENGKTRRIGKAEYEEAHEAWMQAALAETEESVETEEAREVLEQMNHEQNEVNEFTNISPKDLDKAVKAKKTRKSRRQVAREFEVNGQKVTLTEKQVDFIQHLPDTCFWEQGLDSTPWVEVLCDEIGGQFAGKPMTVGAMISTLREKGLLEVGFDQFGGGMEGKGRKAKFFGLTLTGKAIAGEILGV